MDFSIRCAYCHGTTVMRSHINSSGDLVQTDMVWRAFGEMKAKWSGKVYLQGVIFVLPSAEFLPQGKAAAIVDVATRHGGEVLGASFSSPTRLIEENIDSIFARGLAFQGPVRSDTFVEELDGLFELAKSRQQHIDVHVDEHCDGLSDSLYLLAQATIRHGYQGKVVASHCCALSLATPEHCERTLSAVLAAKISIVSLPVCNMYMQDHVPNRTPRWRGVAPVHELRTKGVQVMFASDNVRDAFLPFGDMDMMDTFTQSCHIAQIGPCYAPSWLDAITTTPGRIALSAAKNSLPPLLGLAAGRPADFVLFAARSLREILCRPTVARYVVRNGALIDTTLPSFRELDEININITSKGKKEEEEEKVKEMAVEEEEKEKERGERAFLLLPEIRLESTLKSIESSVAEKEIPVIDISALLIDPAGSEGKAAMHRLWTAATEVGFFQIVSHGIDLREIEAVFSQSKGFFALPREDKELFALRRELNSGFEYFKQVRPSTQLPDQKESFQVRRSGWIWIPSMLCLDCVSCTSRSQLVTWTRVACGRPRQCFLGSERRWRASQLSATEWPWSCWRPSPR